MKKFNLTQIVHKPKLVLWIILQFILGLSYAQVNIQIDSNPAERKNISTYIYGLNPYHYHNNLTGMGLHDPGINVTSLRFGGDAASTYNWELNSNTSMNAACFNNGTSQHSEENDNNKFLAYASGQPASGYNNYAGAILKMANDAQALDAYTFVQITAMQYVAADHAGCITIAEGNNPGNSGRFKEIVIEKPGNLSTSPDLNDAYVYADEEVNFLISQLGNSTSATGIKGYNLENEPAIWSYTHPVTHNQPPTLGEILNKNIDLAKRIKALDPNAETFGMAAYGLVEYVHGVQDYPAADYNTYMTNIPGYTDADYKYMRWMASYLHHMKLASENHGSRLLDVLDLHFYDDGNNIRQGSRSFWDPDYVGEGWISDFYGGQPYNAADNFHKLINDFYPGTKLSVSEWGNFNNSASPDVGIYVADLLGAFGKKDVYMANYWGRLTGFLAGGFKIYTNYDGNGERFGSIGVASSSSDNNLVTAYGSLKNNTEGIMHLVLINRSNAQQNVNISIDTEVANYQSASVYALLPANNGAITPQAPIENIAGNTIAYTLQPSSVYHLVLRDNTIMGVNDFTAKTFIYPNPVKNVLNMQSDKIIGEVKIFDLNGKLAAKQSINADNGTISLEHVPAGNYIVKTSSETFKIIKK